MTGDMTMRERMLAGELYRGDAEIGAELDRAQRLAFQINSTDPTDTTAMGALFTELLGEFGHEAHIRPTFHCDFGYQTRFGARSFANFGLVVLDVAAVTVGEDVQIGPNVQLLTATHPLEPGPRREKWEAAEPITIGDNSVVGAGSVVTRDVPADVVAVGSPAKVVREL